MSAYSRRVPGRKLGPGGAVDDLMTPTACDEPVRLRRSPVAAYLELTKPRQTALLMTTAAGAYLMAATDGVSWAVFVSAMFAMCAAVSGSTALNMAFDRDIDARMSRTAARPIPAGEIAPAAALVFGIALSTVGVAVSWVLDPLYGLIIIAGLGFDVVVYTMWLKRRTPASILVGGISGGMPALAGRALATGSLDAVGFLLAAGVVLWIPAHILTLATRHAAEYEAAGIPVWPSVYGADRTRRLVAAATLGAVVVLVLAGVVQRITPLALVGLGFAGTLMTGLAFWTVIAPSERKNWVLFKAASAYMLFAFVCLTAGSVLR